MKVLRSALISTLLLTLELYSPLAKGNYFLQPGGALDINANHVVNHDTFITIESGTGPQPITLNILPAGRITHLTTQAQALANNDAQHLNCGIYVNVGGGLAPVTINVQGPMSVAASNPSLPENLFYSPAVLLRGNTTFNHLANTITGDIQTNYDYVGLNNVVINLNGGVVNGNIFTTNSLENNPTPALGTVNINQNFTTTGFIKGFSQINIDSPGAVNINHALQAELITLNNIGPINLNQNGALLSSQTLINNSTLILRGGNLAGNVNGNGTIHFFQNYAPQGNLSGQTLVIYPGTTFTLNAPYNINSANPLLLTGASTLRINGGSIAANIRDDGAALMNIEGAFAATAGKSIQVSRIQVNSLGGNATFITPGTSPIQGLRELKIFRGGTAQLAGGVQGGAGSRIENNGNLAVNAGIIDTEHFVNRDNAVLTLTQGSIIPKLENRDNASFVMQNGELRQGITNTSQGRVSILGGVVNGAIENNHPQSIFHVQGGTFNGPFIHQDGKLNISGGRFNRPVQLNAGEINLPGGIVTVSQGLFNNANIKLEGTTTLVGNYTQNAGSYLLTTIKDINHFGKLNITENATLNAGSNVQVNIANNAAVKEGDIFDIITARNATISDVNIITPVNSPFKFSKQLTGQHLRLLTERSHYLVQMAETPHAAAVAKAVEELRFVNTDPQFTSLINHLDNASRPTINQTLTTMVPAHTRAHFYSGYSHMRVAINKAEQRLSLGRSGINLVDKGYSSGDLFGEKGSYGPIAFFNGITQNNKDNFSGYNSSTQGLGLLGDVAVNEYLQLGMGALYSGTVVRTVNDSGKNNISTGELIFYGGLNSGCAFLDGALVGSHNWYRMRRQIVKRSRYMQALVAHSKHRGSQYSGKARVGYDIPFCGMCITPLASIQYTGLYQNGFVEHNVITRRINSEHNHLSQAGAGLKWAFFGESERYIPEVHALYLYDLNNPRLQTTSAFTGGGAAFTVAGPNNPDKSSVNVGGALTAFVGDGVLLTATYDLEKKKQYRSHSGTLKLRWIF